MDLMRFSPTTQLSVASPSGIPLRLPEKVIRFFHPNEEAAAAAWNDQNHVNEFRKIYKKNFEIAHEILGTPIPEATFYIWLEVEDEIEFTKNLYKEKNIKVLPGSFLGRNGLGKGYIRIALVENEEKTREALRRLKDFIDG